jgi:hypothetical protein
MPAVVETVVAQGDERVLIPWSAPVVECYETRPEVTAYAGESEPWRVR